MDDPTHRARHGRREVTCPRHVRGVRLRHGQGRGEGNRLRVPAAEGALPDVAVSHVEEVGGPGPRRAEREDILVARQPLPLSLEAALPGGTDVIQELPPRPP